MSLRNKGNPEVSEDKAENSTKAYRPLEQDERSRLGGQSSQGPGGVKADSPVETLLEQIKGLQESAAIALSDLNLKLQPVLCKVAPEGQGAKEPPERCPSCEIEEELDSIRGRLALQNTIIADIHHRLQI
jgi:hypothetical protein